MNLIEASYLCWQRTTEFRARSGEGSVVLAEENGAVACTAAHNFGAIHQHQQPSHVHHSTALREFLPDPKPLNIERGHVRILHHEGSRVDMCVLTWAVWDEMADIAFFGMRPQDGSKNQFRNAYQFAETMPAIGDEVIVMGYADHKVQAQPLPRANHKRIEIARTFTARSGRVTAHHLEGHILCRGPCVETSIPVFPRMSGSPIATFTDVGKPIMPFGVVSSDPELEDGDKFDTSKSGATIISLFSPKVEVLSDGRRNFIFALNQALSTINSKSE